MLIYEEEAKLISKLTLQYPNIETGGDLFGLWQNESEVVVQLAIGPGENCRRTPTAFFQDERYLGSVGNYLTSNQGLCNIGEWHSHHSLNLPEPSAGDKQTIWRHLPRYGLNRFLLFITTINKERGQPRADIHSFIFTSPENESSRGGMFPTSYKLLPGPNPFRTLRELTRKLYSGSEIVTHVVDYNYQESEDLKQSKKERKMKKKKKGQKVPSQDKKKKSKLQWRFRKHKKGNYSTIDQTLEKVTEGATEPCIESERCPPKEGSAILLTRNEPQGGSSNTTSNSTATYV